MHFDKMIKMYDFVMNGVESWIYKSTNDPVVVFLILYMDDILLIKNDISVL